MKRKNQTGDRMENQTDEGCQPASRHCSEMFFNFLRMYANRQLASFFALRSLPRPSTIRQNQTTQECRASVTSIACRASHPTSTKLRTNLFNNSGRLDGHLSTSWLLGFSSRPCAGLRCATLGWLVLAWQPAILIESRSIRAMHGPCDIH